jgi:hypothetical protein
MADMVRDPTRGRLGPASRDSRGALLHLSQRDAWSAPPPGRVKATRRTVPRRPKGIIAMVALIVLLLLLAILGGLGFAAHVLWFILIVAVILWLIGFFIGGAADAGAGGRRGWYRW